MQFATIMHWIKTVQPKRRLPVLFAVSFLTFFTSGAIVGYWKSRTITSEEQIERIANSYSELRRTVDGWQLVYTCKGIDYVTYDGILGFPTSLHQDTSDTWSFEYASDSFEVIKFAIGFEATHYTLLDFLKRQTALVEKEPSK